MFHFSIVLLRMVSFECLHIVSKKMACDSERVMMKYLRNLPNSIHSSGTDRCEFKY